DAPPARQLCPLIGGFHDPGARSGDRRESRLRAEPADFGRRRVLRIVRLRARRAEDRDRLADVRELVEPFDELAHDAQHAPRVAAREVVGMGERLEEFLVLGAVRFVLIADRVVDAALRFRLARGREARARRICSSWHTRSLLSRVTSREMARKDASVVILVADGVRPDTLAASMSAGEVPALSRLAADGGMHVVTSVFPSVTGPAYAPFLMGRYPGPIGLPGIRWYDREASSRSVLPRARSYVGSEIRKVDRDLDASAPTLFELSESNVAALSVIGRGLRARDREGHSIRFGLRAARVHFSGDVRGWLAIDRDIGARVAHRVRTERPRVAFCALTGIDKTSHSQGHGSPVVRD